MGVYVQERGALDSLVKNPLESQWLKLAHHLQESLGGQQSLLEHSAQEQALVQKAAVAATKAKKKREAGSDINVEEVEVEEARQAGAVHIGRQIWQRLGLDQILAEVGFSPKTCLLTQVMTLNRLIEPSGHERMGMAQRAGRHFETGFCRAQ